MSVFRPGSACRVIVALLLATSLAACETRGGARDAPPFAQLIDQAEAEVGAGRVDAAVLAFNEAARADPLRKEPWVRIAQLHFDAGNYGRAIVAAEEVLQRDATDPVADSVLTVAGLRVAAQSLQRLQGNGAIASESARAEAGRLAATMRATMGAEILADPDAGSTRTPVRRRATSAPRRNTPPPATTAPASPAQGSGSTIANPFGGIGG